MKIILIVLFSLLTINLCYACDSTKMNNVILINLEDSQVANIISDVYSQTTNQYNRNKYVFVIRISKTDDNSEMRISIIHKQHFGWILRDKKIKIYGYFEFEGYPVLVFGDSVDDFFSKTDKYVKFDWLKSLPPLQKLEEGEIPEPSPRFKSDVWIYKYIESEFIFDKKGFYTILE